MQKTIAQFMREGHFEKNLNRMRGIYKAKHDAMVAELKKRDWVLRVFGENSGLHLLVEVDTARTEQELIAACRENDVRIFGLSDYFLSKRVELPKPILLLGYGGLTADKMRVGLGIIEQALK